MLITIFTPSYNRAHLLLAAYESLCKQTCKDFEWLIVDDGSVDNTEVVVNGFVSEQKIQIRYFKKPNGGKHTAINLGAKVAQGELFWILDSDDSLPENAITVVAEKWQRIDNKESLAGICGYMAHLNGEVIGSPIVSEGTVASSIDIRYKLHIIGDMMEVWRTDVIKEYPFSEIQGERFCPEILVWNRIAKEYPLYMIPEVIYYRDYLEGGLTDNIVRVRMNSPVASMMTYSELYSLDISIKERIKAAINYWRFAFCSEKRDVKISSWGNALVPIGWLMHLNDVRKIKK